MVSLLNALLAVVTLVDVGVLFVLGNENGGKDLQVLNRFNSLRIKRHNSESRSQNKYYLLDIISHKKYKRRATTVVLKTTSPPMRTTPPIPTTTVFTTPRPGCKYGMKWYHRGQEIYRGQSGNWCYSASCGDDGNIIYADDFNCVTTTPTMTPETTIPTTLPETTTPNRCFYEGKWYLQGQEVYRGQSGNWCYFARCEYGHVQHADNFNCNPTTTPPTTTPPGCMFEGRWYKPRKEIYNRKSGNWCYSAYCDSTGHIVYADNFNCGTGHTTAPTTSVNTAPIIHVG